MDLFSLEKLCSALLELPKLRTFLLSTQWPSDLYDLGIEAICTALENAKSLQQFSLRLLEIALYLQRSHLNA